MSTAWLHVARTNDAWLAATSVYCRSVYVTYIYSYRDRRLRCTVHFPYITALIAESVLLSLYHIFPPETHNSDVYMAVQMNASGTFKAISDCTDDDIWRADCLSIHPRQKLFCSAHELSGRSWCRQVVFMLLEQFVTRGACMARWMMSISYLVPHSAQHWRWIDMSVTEVICSCNLPTIYHTLALRHVAKSQRCLITAGLLQRAVDSHARNGAKYIFWLIDWLIDMWHYKCKKNACIVFQIQLLGYNSDLYGNVSQALASSNGLAIISLLGQVSATGNVQCHCKFLGWTGVRRFLPNFVHRISEYFRIIWQFQVFTQITVLICGAN